MTDVNTSNFTYKEQPIIPTAQPRGYVSQLRPTPSNFNRNSNANIITNANVTTNAKVITNANVIGNNLRVAQSTVRPYPTSFNNNAVYVQPPQMGFTGSRVISGNVIGLQNRPSIPMQTVIKSAPAVYVPPTKFTYQSPTVQTTTISQQPTYYQSQTPAYQQVTSVINNPVTQVSKNVVVVNQTVSSQNDDRVQVKANSQQWQSFYEKKKQPVRPVSNVAPEKGGMCCPIVFGILGLLALGGLIAGIILAVRAQNSPTTQGTVNSGPGVATNTTTVNIVDPTLITVNATTSTTVTPIQTPPSIPSSAISTTTVTPTQTAPTVPTTTVPPTTVSTTTVTPIETAPSIPTSSSSTVQVTPIKTAPASNPVSTTTSPAQVAPIETAPSVNSFSAGLVNTIQTAPSNPTISTSSTSQLNPIETLPSILPSNNTSVSSGSGTTSASNTSIINQGNLIQVAPNKVAANSTGHREYRHKISATKQLRHSLSI